MIMRAFICGLWILLTGLLPDFSNGGDWSIACVHLATPKMNFMSSYQCHQWDKQKIVNESHCLPTKDQVLRQTLAALKATGLKKLLIATDSQSYLTEFREFLGSDYVVANPNPHLPVVDAYLLANSRHFIGNCVSSFSSFVTRQRQFHNLGTTEFFNWPHNGKDEL